jgi:hypothetical protein
MKKLLFLILLLIPLSGFCQSKEKQYYLYNIVSFEGDFTKENFRVYYDNGTEVKKLKVIKFKTPAGALMYFLSQGWEMYLNGATSEGASFQGTGASETRSYWILRKPCSKEEFNQAVSDAIAK